MKALSVRLQDSLYANCLGLAKKRHTSLNKLVEQALLEQIRQEQQRSLYDAFSLVSEDAAEYDVSFAQAAQDEVA